MIFFAVSLVMMGAAVYNDRLEPRDAFLWIFAVGVLCFVFVRTGWSFFIFYAILIFFNAYWILRVLESDLTLPPLAGRFWKW